MIYIIRHGKTELNKAKVLQGRSDFPLNEEGVRQAEAFARIWNQMKPYVDSERFEAQKQNFDRQAKDAWWWRDACLLYFQQFSGMKLPLDCPAPKYKFEDLQKYNLPIDNYTRAPFDKLP